MTQLTVATPRVTRIERIDGKNGAGRKYRVSFDVGDPVLLPSVTTVLGAVGLKHPTRKLVCLKNAR